MSDERKPRFHINIGVLIVVIIIILILFKIDIKSKINSPQFQENISYIEEQAKLFWNKYILTPIKNKMGEVFVDATSKGIEKIQDNFTENILKVDPAIDSKE